MPRFPNQANPPAANGQINGYKNNNKKPDNKLYSCPFNCSTCRICLNEYVQSKYQVENILIENDGSCFSFFGKELVK